MSRRNLLRWGTALGAGALAGPFFVPFKSDVGRALAAQSAAGGIAIKSLTQLAPFKPSTKVGPKPSLPKRVAWANSSNAQFFLELGASIQAAAKDRGLDYITAIANNDSATNINQMNNFLQVGICALCIQPIDAAAQALVMQRAINQGVDVMALVTPPSTVQVVADQYAVGYAQGIAAAKWIKQHMGGKAKVVIFNINTIQVLIARDNGVKDGLKTAGPGVTIVTDIETPQETEQSAEQTMSTLLQAHPDINVILGTAGDTYSMGALAALRSAGKDTSHMYISGINGDADALAEVVKGGPYKASFAFAYNLMGYAWGQYAADWVEGMTVPQVMVFKPIQLDSKKAIDTFNHAMSLSSIKQSFEQTSTYMRLLGNINYGTRQNYITTSP
jgi:ribose transport system substrate-binding protein